MPTKKRGRPVAPVKDRLLSRCTRPEVGCWEWTAGKFDTGYGALCVDGQNKGAHRVAYELFVGPIEKGAHLDHLCRNPGCVRPDHLEQVTPGENFRRGEAPTAVARRNGTCLKGLHDMTDVYVKKDGQRQCRPCQLAAAKERRAREK